MEEKRTKEGGSWISVKDRLPSDIGMSGTIRIFTYAGCCCKTNFEDGKFDYDLECEEGASSVGMGTPDFVTHWKKIYQKIMPLPQAQSL